MQIKTPCCKLYLQQGAEKQIEQLSVSFIRTIPSVSEFHRIGAFCYAFVDFTTGGEFHSALKQITIILYACAAVLSRGKRK